MKLDNKLIKVMSMIAGGFILLIIIIALIASCTKTKKYKIENISELEAKLSSLAKSYYTENESSLPAEGGSVTLSVQSLVDAKKIDPLNELIENGEACSGSINVLNNNGYYLYLPKIDCGSLYKTKTLADVLLTDENIVTSGNGIYANEYGYVFRGETVNNYIAFANRIWVIIKINNDGSLKIMDTTKRESFVWDDRYNTDKLYKAGINDYITNDINSRIRDRLIEIYNDEEDFDENTKSHLLKQDLCIGKRAEEDKSKDGSTECSLIVQNEMLGLITVSEYLLASLDSKCDSTLNGTCVNYNYLANITPAYWTLTADKNTTNKVYKISSTVNLANATTPTSLKVTALLSGEVLYGSGDGSFENPYVLVTSPYTATKK